MGQEVGLVLVGRSLDVGVPAATEELALLFRNGFECLFLISNVADVKFRNIYIWWILLFPLLCLIQVAT